MPEMVLPGVYIEVRAEGLIGSGRVSVGNIGIVGTASRGELNKATLIGSYSEAQEIFGSYDKWVDGKSNELTLVRSLELAYRGGASTVWAVRVAAAAGVAKASYTVAGSTVSCAKLAARTQGTWGNSLEINVWNASEAAFIENETVPHGATLLLVRKAAEDGRNRVSVTLKATGQTKIFQPVYQATDLALGKVFIDGAGARGELKFHAAEPPLAADDILLASYAVPQSDSRKVTLKYGPTTEVYTVADGRHLMDLVGTPAAPGEAPDASKSQIVEKAGGAANELEIPQKSASALEFAKFGKGSDTPGSDGATAGQTEYETGLAELANENAHILLAAGLPADVIGDELAAHVANASTDKMKRERIAICGTGLESFDAIRGHKLNSDRVVLVTPGIKANDAAASKEVTLPASYTAAVVAGMLSGLDAHISLTNKAVPVGGLAAKYTPDKLEALVQARVLTIEEQQGRGIRIVKGITTEDSGAFSQITTRRIVDFARYGVRQAASGYIGRLNNERVRGAMKSTITGFLQEMLDEEKLTAFSIDVSATRQEEINGLARVTIGLQPTFSIDFIKVTMTLS